MKKVLLLIVIVSTCLSAWSTQVNLPAEHLALPVVQGDHLVCIWDETAANWLQAHQPYDLSGSYHFELPAWGKWYWVGLWDQTEGRYVYGKWVGHFITN